MEDSVALIEIIGGEGQRLAHQLPRLFDSDGEVNYNIH